LIASHAALMIGLVFMGVILLSLFLFSTPAGMWVALRDTDGRLTLGERMERSLSDDDDAQ